jgi:hypothetical protein
MSREPWMLSREEMIGRSLDPPSAGSRRIPARRRLAVKRASMLLVCMAVVAVFISGAALVSLGGGDETGALEPEVPADSTGETDPPYSVLGYTKDGMGDPVPFCTVTITNTNTGEYVVIESDAVGYYMYDIRNQLPSGCSTGDVIHVEAVSESLQLMGENQGTVDLENTAQPFLWLDITLDVVIPEFSMLIVPVAGVMVLFAAVGIRRRARQ